jgi:hypothetical protein
VDSKKLPEPVALKQMRTVSVVIQIGLSAEVRELMLPNLKELFCYFQSFLLVQLHPDPFD